MRINIRVAAIIFKDGKLVTAKMRKRGKVYYILPGGGVEGDETIYEGLKRDLEEELNIGIIDPRLIYIKEFHLEETGRILEFYFHVTDYVGEIKKGFDPEEKESVFEEVSLLDFSELSEVIFYPKQLIKTLESDMNEGFSEVKYLGLQKEL